MSQSRAVTVLERKSMITNESFVVNDDSFESQMDDYMIDTYISEESSNFGSLQGSPPLKLESKKEDAKEAAKKE